MTTENTPQEGRPVVYWDCRKHTEILYHSTLDEAVEAYLDDFARSRMPETVTVHAYARMIAPKPDANDILEGLYEGVWYDLLDPDNQYEFPPEMVAAAEEFVKRITPMFEPWACEVVRTETVNCMDWIHAHRPDWLEPAP